jgi:hypothetical protein
MNSSGSGLFRWGEDPRKLDRKQLYNATPPKNAALENREKYHDLRLVQQQYQRINSAHTSDIDQLFQSLQNLKKSGVGLTNNLDPIITKQQQGLQRIKDCFFLGPGKKSHVSGRQLDSVVDKGWIPNEKKLTRVQNVLSLNEKRRQVKFSFVTVHLIPTWADVDELSDFSCNSCKDPVSYKSKTILIEQFENVRRYKETDGIWLEFSFQDITE